MFGINKRLDKIEYRLARIDKMIEDLLVLRGMTVPKQVPSVVIDKPKLKQNNWYPEKMAVYMTSRYRTIEEISVYIGCTHQSVNTYLKHMRKSGVEVMKRGRAPTEYKVYNPHKGATLNV